MSTTRLNNGQIERYTFAQLAKMSNTLEQQALTNHEMLVETYREFVIKNIHEITLEKIREEIKQCKEDASINSYREHCRENLIRSELDYFKHQLAEERKQFEQSIKQIPEVQQLQVELQKLQTAIVIIDKKIEAAKTVKTQAQAQHKQAAKNINERRKLRHQAFVDDLVANGASAEVIARAQQLKPTNLDELCDKTGRSDVHAEVLDTIDLMKTHIAHGNPWIALAAMKKFKKANELYLTSSSVEEHRPDCSTYNSSVKDERDADITIRVAEIERDNCVKESKVVQDQINRYLNTKKRN